MTTKKQQAEQIALSLLTNLGIVSAPVDVVEVAKTFGVVVVKKHLEEEVSGFLIARENRAVIGVNEGHHPNRQRFTIAHELGHYLLHVLNNGRQDFFLDSTFYRDSLSGKGTDLQEIEANTFAASLLMPQYLLEDCLQTQKPDLSNSQVVSQLASKFEVSEQALNFRLIALGFITA